MMSYFALNCGPFKGLVRIHLILVFRMGYKSNWKINNKVYNFIVYSETSIYT